MANLLIVSEFAGKQGMHGPQWRYFLPVQGVCRMALACRSDTGPRDWQQKRHPEECRVQGLCLAGVAGKEGCTCARLAPIYLPGTLAGLNDIHVHIFVHWHGFERLLIQRDSQDLLLLLARKHPGQVDTEFGFE